MSKPNLSFEGEDGQIETEEIQLDMSPEPVALQSIEPDSKPHIQKNNEIQDQNKKADSPKKDDPAKAAPAKNNYWGSDDDDDNDDWGDDVPELEDNDNGPVAVGSIGGHGKHQTI